MRIGIDLGGTKIEVVAMDDAGAVLYSSRVSTPRHNYDGTVKAIVELVHSAEVNVGGSGSVGIGTPGAVSPATGRMKNANSTWLNNKPLQEDIEAALGRPVRLANDANCFALSEATDGAGEGAPVVFGVILGTGVGGGVVVNGLPLLGRNAVGGEWGHNPLPAPTLAELPGPNCYCGRSGCIERFLSGPGLARSYLTQTGKSATGEEIVASAPTDSNAEAILCLYEDRLARALGSVINLLDPDCIVLGGGLSQVSRFYERVPKLWLPYVFSDKVDTALLPPRFGDASGVRGAAWLWDR